MIKGIEGINIASHNAKRLAEFYEKKVGLKLEMEAEIGDKGQSAFIFEIKSGSNLVIMDDFKVKGKNTLPERFVINFEVDNLEKEFKRMLKAKVKKILDIYHIENYGYLAAFEDPDGNYFQLVKTRK